MISSIQIKKFRGFNDVEFDLGSSLTVIAGQNGTQKTTLLGILSQPFSITDKTHPLYGEKPLCGGNFRSAFAEKFKLSSTHDIAGQHEWSLRLDNIDEQFELESIKRNDSKNPGSIRFWRKGDRSKGSGYIQTPVIYLSLSRLLPIGEDEDIGFSSDVVLSKKESEFYKKWHNDILIIFDDMSDVEYLASKNKNTLGVNTDKYDWKMNSAGQDNIGKILLAILSFQRLKEKHKGAYDGGILVIDELDATLFPQSQIRLLKAFRKFASKYKLQIIFTTHSLSILKKACELQDDEKVAGQIKVVFLKKVDDSIIAQPISSYDAIKRNLEFSKNESVRRCIKIPVFREDSECETFAKAILKGRSSSLDFIQCNLGGEQLIHLSKVNVPGIRFPDSLIILDGDIKGNISKSKNILLLPGGDSPEKLLSEFLMNLSDSDPIWSEIDSSKQECFEDFKLEDIVKNREIAKNWFNDHKKSWGRNCVRVINPWIKENKDAVDEFTNAFDKIVDQLKKDYS